MNEHVEQQQERTGATHSVLTAHWMPQWAQSERGARE